MSVEMKNRLSFFMIKSFSSAGGAVRSSQTDEGEKDHEPLLTFGCWPAAGKPTGR